MLQHFDYIVVGGGSAGCVVAHRLSEDPSTRVLLIDAGRNHDHPMVSMPAGWAKISHDKNFSWVYQSEPEPYMNFRQILAPRGKVLGGCSSTNGMLYIRGQREDYDDWASMGNDLWAYDKVLPFFKRSENCTIENADDTYHGSGGLLDVAEARYRTTLSDAYIDAAVNEGHPHNPDFNGSSQEGVGRFHVTQKNGRRHSSANAFLDSAKGRENLTIFTEAYASKIILVDKAAEGVIFRDKNNQEHRVFAEKEVILSLGAFHTPQLLELSGIGNRRHLNSLGLSLKHELNGVGENLQEHLTVNVVYAIKNSLTLLEDAKPLRLLKHIPNYLLKKQGLLTLPGAEVGVFIKGEGDARPSYQIHFVPSGGKITADGQVAPERPSVTSTCCLLRPESRGSVHIKSTDPKAGPAIKFNFLSAKADQAKMIEAVKMQRKIYHNSAFDHYRLEEDAPGVSVTSDDAILDYVKDSAQTAYHPMGTCKMGNDARSVVDQHLKVRGIEGLRIADASVFPSPVSGNTNATAIMVGERCADFILNG